MKNNANGKVKYFSDFLVKEWEDEDGVNFAIALARVSGWLLHVDWLTPFRDAPVEMMKPLRVYVAADNDYVFDFNGKKSLEAFNKYVISPIAEKRNRGFLAVYKANFIVRNPFWSYHLG